MFIFSNVKMLMKSNRNIFTVIICLHCVFLKAQLLVPYWTIEPRVSPNPYYTFCKGECIQFIDSSFFITAPNPWAGTDTVIKRYWFFTGTSSKIIPINSFNTGSFQPIYPYATDTFAFDTKQNPPLLCYDSIGLFAVGMGCIYSNGFRSASLDPYSIKIIDAPYYIAADTQHIKVHFPDIVTLSACASGDNYKWEPTEDGACTSCTNYSIKPFSNKIYTCTVSNNNGCSKICIYTVEVEDAPEALYIPSAFTPNGDGLNDVFTPVLLNKTVVLFRIYNRWGEKIIEQHDSNSSWDGSYKGKAVEAGVYLYSVVYTDTNDNLQKTLTGIIALVR